VSRWDRRSKALTWPPTWRRLDRRRHAGLDDRRIWWSCSQHIPELRGDPTRLTDNGLRGTKARGQRRWRRRGLSLLSSARRVGGADIGTDRSSAGALDVLRLRAARCGNDRDQLALAARRAGNHDPFGTAATEAVQGPGRPGPCTRVAQAPGTTVTVADVVPAKGPPTTSTVMVCSPGGSGRIIATYPAVTNVVSCGATPRTLPSGSCAVP
jgi:hypothetical protein